MRFKPQWYDTDKSVIFIAVEDDWTWDDVYGAIDTIRTMIFETRHREIGILADMTTVNTHPVGVEDHLSQILSALPLKVQYVCTASRDRWVRMVYEVMTDVYDNLSNDYRVVETVNEAEAFLSDKLGKRIQQASRMR